MKSDDSIKIAELQWTVALERIKHIETLIMSCYTLFLFAAGFILRDVLRSSKEHQPNMPDYWFSVMLLSVISIGHFHAIVILVNNMRAAFEIEKSTEGDIKFLSSTVCLRSWLGNLGFLTIVVSPALCTTFVWFSFAKVGGVLAFPCAFVFFIFMFAATFKIALDVNADIRKYFAAPCIIPGTCGGKRVKL